VLRCCLSVCLSVSRQNAKKCDFLNKLSNLELWSLVTTYSKSYMGFLKNPLLDPENQRWRRSAMLDLDAKETIIESLNSKVAGIRHFENQHDVIFFLPRVVRFG